MQETPRCPLSQLNTHFQIWELFLKTKMTIPRATIFCASEVSVAVHAGESSKTFSFQLNQNLRFGNWFLRKRDDQKRSDQKLSTEFFES